jgi:hypothetical protein
MDHEFRKLDKTLAIAVAALMAAAVPIGILGLIGLQQTADALSVQAAAPHDPLSDEAQTVERNLGQVRWDIGLQAAGVGVALAGAALAAMVAWGYPRRRWPLAAVAVAAVYLLLDAAPAASSLVSFFLTLGRHVVIDSTASVATAAVEPLAVARFALAVLAVGLYVAIAWRLTPRLFYGLTCGSLGAAALFFHLWSPPPPRPVPIAHPLARQWLDEGGRRHLMADEIVAALNAEEVKAGRPADWTGRHEPLTKVEEQQVGADDYLNLVLQSPDKQHFVEVYITYNADAMSNIPHVPWVCMVQGGAFEVVRKRTDDMVIQQVPGREFSANVLLFQPGAGRTGPDIFMFQYFNAGWTYEHDRDVARAIAAAGAHSQAGSFISQTQVRVMMSHGGGGGDATDRHSPVYGLGVQVLNIVVPLLEKEYYPDLRGTGSTKGGAAATPRGTEGG